MPSDAVTPSARRRIVVGRDAQLGDRLADALGEVVRADHLGARQDHRHLLAAVARGRIDAAHLRLDDVRDRAQHTVSDEMPVRVVELLEIVDVASSRPRTACRSGASARSPRRCGRRSSGARTGRSGRRPSRARRGARSGARRRSAARATRAAAGARARTQPTRDDCTATTPSQSPYMNSGTPSHERMPCAAASRRRRRSRSSMRRAVRVLHHPARGALALPPSCWRKNLSLRAIEAVHHELRVAAGAAMHERDRLGLGDRLARSRARPPRRAPRAAATAENRRAGRVEDLEVVHALLQLVPRARQPREHEVDQQIRQRQQHEAERLIRVVEQHEHDADRHQRRLGDDARQRELAQVRRASS